MNLKETQEMLEKHQSCLHCGKQGHNHTHCLWTFVSETYPQLLKDKEHMSEVERLRLKKKQIHDELFKAACHAMDVINEEESKQKNKRKYKW